MGALLGAIQVTQHAVSKSTHRLNLSEKGHVEFQSGFCEALRALCQRQTLRAVIMSSNQQPRLLITKTLVANSDDVRRPINLVDAVSRASERNWDFSQMLDGYWWTLEATQDGVTS